MKTIITGIALTLLGGLFWSAIIANPLRELQLVTRAQITPGLILEAAEDMTDRNPGKPLWHHWYVYCFTNSSGEIITNVTRTWEGRLPEQYRSLDKPAAIEVGYLTTNPRVSRIKGTGPQSIFEWAWRNMIGLLLLAVLVAPGITILIGGIMKRWGRCDGKSLRRH